MKVTAMHTTVVDNVPPYSGGKRWLFLRLVTDDGIVGLGERPTGGLANVASQVALLEDLSEAFVIGEDPFNVERIWQRVFASRHDFRHAGMDSTPALCAIEMALWDIIGKATNQPIYRLLGGQCHERLRAYSYMPVRGEWKDPGVVGEVAAKLLSDGWTLCKVDPFTPVNPYPRYFTLKDLQHGVTVFKRIRDTVGYDLEVAVGTHSQFSTAGAIRAARMLEEYLPAWFEEPVPPEKVEEMARVAAQTSIPIAAGERLATKYECVNLLEKQAAGIIQLDVGQCGGILEAKKIAAIAEAHHALIAPHMFVGPIAAAAAIQLDACTPNFMIQEFNVGPLHSSILTEPFTIANGYINLPTGPGLGVALNEDVVRRQLSR